MDQEYALRLLDRSTIKAVKEFGRNVELGHWEDAIKNAGNALEGVLKQVLRDVFPSEKDFARETLGPLIQALRACKLIKNYGRHVSDEILARVQLCSQIRNMYSHDNKTDYDTSEVHARFMGSELNVFIEWAAKILVAPSRDRLPAAIRDHLERLQNFTLKRLDAALGESITSVADARRMVASRTALEARSPDRRFELPLGLLQRLDEAAGQHSPYVPEIVILGDAGEGKSVILNALVCEFAEPYNVIRWNLVPIFVDCITLYSLFPEKPDEAGDAEALARWFALAIEPRRLDVRRTKGVAENNKRIEEFAENVKRASYRLILIIDGFDELSAGAAFGKDDQITRLLNALAIWQTRHGIEGCYRIATTRPYYPDIGSLSDLKEVRLVAVTEQEITRLAAAQGIHEAGLPIFTRAFQTQLDGKMVYFWPLARHFSKHGITDELQLKSLSQSSLMEEEIEHAVDETYRQLCRGADPGSLPRHPTAERIRNVLILIALDVLDVGDPNQPKSLLRDRISQLAGLADLVQPANLQGPTVAAKILNVLVFARTGRQSPTVNEELWYRLPHNDYRDYLLSDGLFRLIIGKLTLVSGTGDEQETVATGLARSYGRSERVRYFFGERLRERSRGDNPEITGGHLARQLIGLMNDRSRLRSEGPDERSDVSAHGALLSLLMDLAMVHGLPQWTALDTKGANFHGAVVRSNTPSRIRLPGTGDWSGSVLREADLRGADLSGLNFTGADFDNASLNGSDLSRASLVRANLRNVAMGRYAVEADPTRGGNARQSALATVLTGAKFDDGINPDSGADWFNYRFQGLRGYYCFWDMEPVLGDSAVIIAGSRGELLMFSLRDETFTPVCLQTDHDDDILDISSHPTRGLIVTTSRDGTVRLHKLTGASRSLAGSGKLVPSIREVQVLSKDDLFGESKYPRRAQFSKSGRWLVVVARDPRVKFFRVEARPDGHDLILDGEIGRAHTGPVMCVSAEEDNFLPAAGSTVRDRFYTAGYDGRIVAWTEEPDRRRVVYSWPTTIKSREVIRSLVPASLEMGSAVRVGFWVGTESDCRLGYYVIKEGGLVEEPALGRRFDSGVFCIAVDSTTNILALGLASGDLLLFRHGADGTYDLGNPAARCSTGDEIIRSIQFIDRGQRLLTATWDGRLHLFALDRLGSQGALVPVKSYAYPQADWRPELDVDSIVLGAGTDLSQCKGLSTRMRQYLSNVGQQAEGSRPGGPQTRAERP